MKLRYIATSILLLITTLSFCQNKYWIFFTDKDISAYQYTHALSPDAIANRSKLNISLIQYSDVPLISSYIQELQAMGICVAHRSKWLNALSALLTPVQIIDLKKLSFVKSIEPINSSLLIASTDEEVSPTSVHTALSQMQSSAFIDKGLTGMGVKVGVIDAGFYRANLEKNLEHLFSEFKIIAQRDFQNPERKDIITESVTPGDGHGKSVLEKICGYDPDQRIQFGMAVNSNFYLARTENGAKENRGEEDKWIEAMEWMDSLGVRLISTSLGYATKMDDPKDNYLQEQMNGKTSKIAKAAQIAVDEKGIFLVVSAGNEGSSAWRIISSPADCQGALSVGATREYTLDRIGYSSIGPDFLPYLKPEVSCYSPNGTSFSAPAVAGFVACLMQQSPTMTNKQIKDIMVRSAHLYPYGNNFIGYGVPQADRALQLLVDPNYEFKNTIVKEVKGKKIKFKLPKPIPSSGIVFHKKNETLVIKQEEVNLKKGKISITRMANEAQTTLSIGTLVVEFIWQKKI